MMYCIKPVSFHISLWKVYSQDHVFQVKFTVNEHSGHLHITKSQKGKHVYLIAKTVFCPCKDIYSSVNALVTTSKHLYPHKYLFNYPTPSYCYFSDSIPSEITIQKNSPPHKLLTIPCLHRHQLKSPPPPPRIKYLSDGSIRKTTPQGQLPSKQLLRKLRWTITPL